MKFAINHRIHTHSQIPQGNDFSAASEVNCSSRCDQDPAMGLQGAFQKWEHLMMCVLLQVGSLEALNLSLTGSSGLARQNQQWQQFRGCWSSHPNAACGVNCPGASLQQEELGIGARSSPLGHQLCMLSPASWEGAGHHLLLSRGVREEPGGHLALTKVNPAHLFESTLHPSHLLPQGLTDSVCPQGKQTEHCTASHSVPKSEVVSAFYLFHKQKEP